MSSYVSEELNNVICGYHLAILSPDSNKMSGRFLHHMFGLNEIQHYFYMIANGITRFGLDLSRVTIVFMAIIFMVKAGMAE